MPNIENVLTSWAFVAETAEWNIKLAEVLSWLTKFKPSEIESAIKIMENIQYYDDNRIRSIVSKLSNKVSSILGDNVENSFFFPLGTSSASSGSMYLYQYYKELKLNESNFKQDSFENYLNLNVNIIFFDDIIGSGNQATKFFDKYLKDKPAKCYYFSLLGLERGISYIKDNAQFKLVVAGEELTDEEMAFTNNSQVFSEEEQNVIKPICEKYGKLLYRAHPLGYDNTQALIVFPHNTPNNTLPIIWASDDNEAAKGSIQWNPLWNRKKASYKSSKIRESFSDSFFNMVIKQCNETSKKFSPYSIKTTQKQEAGSNSYKISLLDNEFFLKVTRNMFFNTDNSILVWLYKNKCTSDDASFNAIVEQNTKGIKVMNLGLFLNNQNLEINFASIEDFMKELFNEILSLIR